MHRECHSSFVLPWPLNRRTGAGAGVRLIACGWSAPLHPPPSVRGRTAIHKTSLSYRRAPRSSGYHISRQAGVANPATSVPTDNRPGSQYLAPISDARHRGTRAPTLSSVKPVRFVRAFLFFSSHLAAARGEIMARVPPERAWGRG